MLVADKNYIIMSQSAMLLKVNIHCFWCTNHGWVAMCMDKREVSGVYKVCCVHHIEIIIPMTLCNQSKTQSQAKSLQLSSRGGLA